MKQHSKPKKVQLFSEMLNIGKNCVSCMVANGYQNKILEMSALSCIVMTPYFYFIILKIMCSYTKYLSIIEFSRTEIYFIFIFMSKLSYFL